MNAVIENPVRLSVTRSFDAPPHAVFEAWLDKSWSRWLGPEGVQCLDLSMDARVGGAWRYRGRMPDGTEFLMMGSYREIRRPSWNEMGRLVFTWNGCQPGIEDTLVIITFKASGAGTEMTLSHERFGSEDQCRRHEHGWSASLDRLAAHLAATA